MDFGKLPNVDTVDFTLPADSLFNQTVWDKVEPTASPQVFIGGPLWANKSYVGRIYPSQAKERDFLHYYTRQFNTIELNSTHYQIPTPGMIEKWKTEAASSPIRPRFVYCPKFPQAISHERALVAAESLTEEFVNAVLSLEEFLGTTFLQLPPNFGPDKWPVLEKYLKSLPDDLEVAVEFRHPDWFRKPAVWQQTLERLCALHRHVVISDVAGRRDVLHMSLTSPNLVLRFVANEGHKTDYERTDAWVERLKTWFGQGLQTAYLFIHGGELNDTAPELIRYWVQRLNAVCGLNLQEPTIRPEVVQGSLF
ncbi:uncharacterized protein YecE (DUF72 family) [Larkinella arboricola]|uniref:Uncharacterized protein YecE (DUF72 family) n=1 Tax=Larkinella arboricola TaxID=643671 RepID=A0A327X5A0_LARAB|nr:DUF72 domain-containing protein [Larkinella arboricola]RAK01911.1 uncharacterized protein YecE (DUF72 family) [Larkinella arboricola]